MSLNDFSIIDGTLEAYVGRDKNVVIPDEVTVIGHHAFQFNETMQTVKIPVGVTEIEERAFVCCALSKVEIPDGVTSIGESAFEDCERLKSVIIPSSVISINEDAFKGCGLTTLIIPEGVKSIESRAFSYCVNLEKVVIPSSIESIGDDAFANCWSLTDVTIPKNVTGISLSTFRDCNSLAKKDDSEEFTIINGVLIEYKGSGKNLEIPDNVTEFGAGVFKGCPDLADENGFVIVRDILFDYLGTDENIRIPDGVVKVGDVAFSDKDGYDNKTVKSVEIPDSVTSIGSKAFCGCKALNNIILPNSLTNIGDEAFENCISLESIVIPNNVKSIGDKAFYRCKALESVTLPENMAHLGKGLFDGCSCLKNVMIPNGIKKIEDNTFNCCASLEKAVIPTGVFSIGKRAFSNCTNLLSVEVPDGVQSIGREAFILCKKMTSINIPESVSSIGEYAFGYCYELKSMILPEESQLLKSRVFGEELPESLHDSIDSLYKHMNDGALIRYVVIKKVWKTLSPELQAELFLSRQSDSLTRAYSVCICSKKNTEEVGREILKALTDTASDKTCKAAAQFLIQFPGVSNKLKQQIQDKLNGSTPVGESLKAIKADQTLSPVGKMVTDLLLKENRTEKEIIAALKTEYSLSPSYLPIITDNTGRTVEPFVLSWLLLKGRTNGRTVTKEEKEILGMLDRDSFMKALRELADRFLGSPGVTKKHALAFPICKYADDSLLADLTKTAVKWRSSGSGNNAPPLRVFREAILNNDSRIAMMFAERLGDLRQYASLREMDEQTFRDRYLSDVGLGPDRSKTYDLGNQTVIVRMQKDFSFIVEMPESGKTAKSLPKKGSDAKKYEEANKDFSNTKKAVKDIVKSRSNQLFKEFLRKNEKPARDWKEAYLNNPILRDVASLLVWNQDDNFFTVSETDIVGSDGKPVVLGSTPISLSHPMDMKNQEVIAWQNYFALNGLKQPFAQVWEPVRNPEEIKKDRYKGCRIPYYRFRGQEKHGIKVEDRDFHDEIHITFEGCNANVERIIWRRHAIDNDDPFEITNFKFRKYTKKVNHIVAYLDRITLYERIRKDDMSAVENLKEFTLAQILECIDTANKSGSKNCLAALLEEKQNRWPEYSGIESLLLD